MKEPKIDCTQFLYQPSTLRDEERAGIFRSQQPLWKEYDNQRFPSTQSVTLHIPAEEACCLGTRSYLRPPGTWNPARMPSHFHLGISHLHRCSTCRQWYEEGMPFHFDMRLRIHRDIFCGCVQEAMEQEVGSPLTFAAALEHADQCEACGRWYATLVKSRSCENVQNAYEKGTRYIPDLYFNPELELFDHHFAACPACQDWSLTLSCSEVRENIEYVDRFNESEKITRQMALLPSQEWHIAHCNECTAWNKQYQRQYKEQLHKEFPSLYGEYVAPLSDTPVNDRQTREKKIYATLEDTIEAILQFLQENPEPPTFNPDYEAWLSGDTEETQAHHDWREKAFRLGFDIFSLKRDDKELLEALGNRW